MHASERCRSSNTARVLEMALTDCEVLLVGEKDNPFKGIRLQQDEANFVLYPEPSAAALSTEYLKRTISASIRRVHLIVPDGSWTQAKRIVHGNIHLRGIPRVQLAELAPSAYLLRKNGRTGGVCTAEAVAHALGEIEGEQLKNELLHNFTIMRDNVLESHYSRWCTAEESAKHYYLTHKPLVRG